MANSRREDNKLDKDIKQKGQHGSCKPYLAFSIDNILRRKEETALNTTHVVHAGNKAYTTRSAEIEVRQGPPKKEMVNSTKITHLPWLAYTRYSPPKLPRSKRRLNNSKRRSSGCPRVPFSTSQLMTLEQKYTENHYLSGKQVTELARSLDLPQHRIKIWFQNRRAREKRNQEESSINRMDERPTNFSEQVELNTQLTACFAPLPLTSNFSMDWFGLGSHSHYEMLNKYFNMGENGPETMGTFPFS
ncbi:homeobox protein MSH-D-like [Stylophora pistillata]|uniref:Homeobox protein MSX-2 n=1 Tax=Stylophora pistillata TaxID=50429 RepID=A0A2B4RU62_STYPI|nr:homeobox protein MSH-D-like [Stylophora pistillata]PFX20706.1 Homeobox protein MSX-2 [Stylophora pistillata]